MDNNKTVKQEENVAILGDKEIKESEMSLEQKYFTKQIADLRNKKAQITNNTTDIIGICKANL